MKRNKKRRIATGIAGALLFGLLFATGSLGQGEAPSGPWREDVVRGSGSNKIAIIEIEGEIVSEGDGFARSSSPAERIRSQVQQAHADDAVKAVILKINSPGGSVVASDQILHELETLKEETPIVATFGEVAASGGYLVASRADRIVANPSTITGSIGAIMVVMNVEEAAGKLGIDPIVIKSGEFKDIGSPFSDMSDEEREMLQSLIDQAHQRFIDFVAEGRDMPRSEVESIADGRIISGSDALDAGLVDELGNLDHAISHARELANIDDVRVVEYVEPFSPFDIFRGLGTKVGLIDEVQRSLEGSGPVLKYMWTP